MFSFFLFFFEGHISLVCYKTKLAIVKGDDKVESRDLTNLHCSICAANSAK